MVLRPLVAAMLNQFEAICRALLGILGFLEKAYFGGKGVLWGKFGLSPVSYVCLRD